MERYARRGERVAAENDLLRRLIKKMKEERDAPRTPGKSLRDNQARLELRKLLNEWRLDGSRTAAQIQDWLEILQSANRTAAGVTLQHEMEMGMGRVRA